MPKKGRIYDTGVTNILFTTAVSQVTYLRPRGTFTAHTPDQPDAATVVLAWGRSIVEAILYRKRPSTRSDASYPRAPTEYSDQCRKKRYLRHRSKLAPQRTDRPSVTTPVLPWGRAIVEAIVYPKRSSNRRDTHDVSACTNTIFDLALVLVCTCSSIPVS